MTLALVKHAHVCVQKTIQTDRQIDIKTDRHIAKVYRPRDRQTVVKAIMNFLKYMYDGTLPVMS